MKQQQEMLGEAEKAGIEREDKKQGGKTRYQDTMTSSTGGLHTKSTVLKPADFQSEFSPVQGNLG